VVFADGRFLLHADGNGKGTQVDQRTLEQLMRLRLISRVPDADPAHYVINVKGRGALKARAQFTGTYRCLHCPHPDGCTLTGNACAMCDAGDGLEHCARLTASLTSVGDKLRGGRKRKGGMIGTT